MATLTYATPDVNGDVPDITLLFHTYKHKKGGVYILSDYVWNAKTDAWDAFYTGSGTPVPFTRSIREFFDGRFVLFSLEDAEHEDAQQSENAPAQDHAASGDHVGNQDDSHPQLDGEADAGREGGSEAEH